MSSFHQATTTRLASLAAVSSSEDSARSMACTAGQGWLHCNSVNVEHAETIGRLLQSGQAGTLLLGHSMLYVRMGLERIRYTLQSDTGPC